MTEVNPQIYSGAPCNKIELIEYCKRKLGAPILKIDVTEEQSTDIINDTLQFFHTYCYGGMTRTYMTYKLTQEDINRMKTNNPINEENKWSEKNNYIEMPDHVTGVNRIFGVNTSNIRGNLFGLEYRIFTDDLYTLGSIDLVNYATIQQYLETIDQVVNNGAFIQHRFHSAQNRLYIDTDIGTLVPDNYLLIEAQRFIDPSEVSKIYNDIFVKRYAMALMKKQWGQNLLKYKDVELPGGRTLNAEMIYNEGVRELEKIEMEAPQKYYDRIIGFIA